MARRHGWIVAFALAWIIVSTGAWAQQAADGSRRVALVVGNDGYAHTRALRNAANDARAIAEALRRLGFEVTVATDQSRRDLERALVAFSRQSEGAAIALFYYAGHGIQAAGINYLLPIDGQPRDERDLRAEAIDMREVLESVGDAQFRMIVLDACRNNPLADSLRARGRSIGRGLARIDVATPSTLLVFSAAPGAEAEDGPGPNSPFAGALLAHLETRGLDVQQLMTRVTRSTQEATRGQQTPEVTARGLGREVFLAPAAPASETPVPTASLPSFDPRALDLAFWSAIQASTERGDFEEYLRRFPDGIFAGLARNRLAALRPAPQGPAPQGPAPQGPAPSPAATTPAPTPPPPAATASATPAAATPAAAPLQACDQLAAPRFLAGAPGPGIDLEAMNGAAAVDACEWAVAAFPGEPRFRSYLARAYYRSGATAPAASRAQPAAEAGDPLALYLLAMIYRDGRGDFRRDDARAVQLLRRAADGGYVVAQVDLAIMLADGRGTARNQRESLRLLRAAAERGEPRGQNSLGLAYQDGRGIARDEREALRWFRAAAEQGMVPARLNLAAMVGQGRGTERNEAEAQRILAAIAERGDPRGWRELAGLYRRSTQLPRNYPEALRLLRLAMERNDPEAFNLYGLMLRAGEGIARDDAGAVRHFRMAMERGSRWGIFNLGGMHEAGRGVPADRDEAIRLYRLAADQWVPEAFDALRRLGAAPAAAPSPAASPPAPAPR